MVHKLVKFRFNPSSFPAYRYEAECSCGFATKMPNEEAAKSQFTAHLQGKGVSVEEYMQDTSEIVKDRTIHHTTYTFPELEGVPKEEEVNDNQLTQEQLNQKNESVDTTVASNEPNADTGQASKTPSGGGLGGIRKIGGDQVDNANNAPDTGKVA